MSRAILGKQGRHLGIFSAMRPWPGDIFQARSILFHLFSQNAMGRPHQVADDLIVNLSARASAHRQEIAQEF